MQQRGAQIFLGGLGLYRKRETQKAKPVKATSLEPSVLLAAGSHVILRLPIGLSDRPTVVGTVEDYKHSTTHPQLTQHHHHLLQFFPSVRLRKRR